MVKCVVVSVDILLVVGGIILVVGVVVVVLLVIVVVLMFCRVLVVVVNIFGYVIMKDMCILFLNGLSICMGMIRSG